MTLRDYQALELITPPTGLPLTIEVVKDHLNIDDSDRDALVTQMIMSAVSFIDGLGVLGKAMMTQTWGQWYPASPSEAVIRMLPIQSIDAVKYYDTDGVLQTATLADFELQSAGEWAIVKPVSGASWPPADSREAAIKIEYIAGYGDANDVPDAIKQALLMLVAHWFENRESTTDIRLETTPFGFDELISTHRSGWYG